MWVIQRKGDEVTRFLRSVQADCGKLILYFHYEQYAFRFPDENTAFAVLAFLDCDNIGVTCIE